MAWVWWLKDGPALGVRRTAAGPSYAALLRVGAAACVSNAAESGAFSGMTMLAGRQGGGAVAAYQILLNLLSIVFMLSLGVASATAVLTSAAVGRQQPSEAARASFGGVLLNVAFMLGVAVLVVAGQRAIGRAYTANLTLAASVSSLLWLAAAIMPPDGAQVVAASALRARGDNWFPTASHLLAYTLVMPALAFWLAEARGQGVSGLMIAILFSSLLSAAVLAWRLRWLSRATRAAVAP